MSSLHMNCYTHSKRNVDGGGLKLDMSKAYDRIEWPYLMKVMEAMGFSLDFCYLIFQCVSTVSFSVLLNGSPMGHIVPSRGLRQGDPLSPYLFILCAEGLSRILQREAEAQHLQGIKVARRPISHLLFADDCFLFCRASLLDARTMKDLLLEYERGNCVPRKRSI